MSSIDESNNIKKIYITAFTVLTAYFTLREHFSDPLMQKAHGYFNMYDTVIFQG